MGLLTLASSAAYARTSASQSEIGTATALWFKARVNGAALNNGPAAPNLASLWRIGTTPGTTRAVLFVARVGADAYVGISDTVGANAAMAVIPASSLGSDAYFRIYAHAGPAGYLTEIYDQSGSLIGSGAEGGITLPNAGASNGNVWIGETSTPGVAGAIDGLAIGSGTLAGAARIAAPHPDDPGILWAVVDDGGNLVEGATDLANYNAATWGPGGEWHRPEPAPAYSGTLSAAAQPATASLSGTHAAPVPMGTLAAAAGAALVAIAGAYAPPAGGALSAQAQAATASISGSYEAPITGALSAAAGLATASLSGTHQFDGRRALILGESQLDEYRADDNRAASGPWQATTLNAVELMASAALGQPFPATHTRDLDVGPWSNTSRGEPRRRGFERNLARSSAQMEHLLDLQLPLALSMMQQDIADFAVLMMTGNEWGSPSRTPYLLDWIYHGDGTLDRHGVPVVDRMQFVFDQADQVMTQLTPLMPAGLVVITPPRYGDLPMVLAGFPDPVRRGYVNDAVEYLKALLRARADAINSAAGRTRVVIQDWDELFLPVWATDTGTHVTIAGVALDYTENPLSGEPTYFNVGSVLSTSVPHIGTVGGGLLANTIIAGLNQLPGVSIEPFTDREIRENAGIFADEVTGSLAATADPASAQLTGAHTAPTYAGELSATAQAASSAITGAHTAPAYAGALGASAGAATASLSGTHAAPQEDGALRAAAQPATVAIAGSYAAPVHVGQLVALAAPATAQIAGAYAVPAGGTLRVAAQRATASLAGSYAASGAVGTLAAAAQPATAQIAGTHRAPAWAGSVAAVAGPASAAIFGRYAEPGVIVGRLRAAAAPASAHIEAEYTYSGVVHPVRATLSVSSIKATLTVMDA